MSGRLSSGYDGPAHEEMVEVRVLIRKSQRDTMNHLARLTDTANATVIRSALYAGIHTLINYWARQWGMSDEWVRDNLAALEPGHPPDFQPHVPLPNPDDLPF